MIDSVALAWGHAEPVESKDAHGGTNRRRRQNFEPLAPPVYLDVDELAERHGYDQGQVRSIKYGDKQPTFGHWQEGVVDYLYREGRLEVRASLPKVLTGRNDVVLDEVQTHEALRELVRRAETWAGHPLDLRQAVPTRLDPVFQWEVPSVRWIGQHIKSTLHPARKLVTEHTNPKGGYTLAYGMGSKRVLRFYDKAGESISKGEETALELDTVLRFEIQERRRGHVRLLHERGYRGHDVHHELERALEGLGAVAMRDAEAIIAAAADSWRHALAYTLGSLYVVDRPEILPVIRHHFSYNAAYRWRQRARAHALEVGTWAPEIPFDVFGASSSPLWALADAA